MEAGLGGRLDATNVLARSRVVVLTNIDLEHTQLLGETREAIASEKLAVVHPGAILIVGRRSGLRRRLRARRSWRPTAASRIRTARLRGPRSRPPWDVRSIPAGMAAVVVPGRLELRGQRPLEIWDGAHNPAGMRRLVAELPPLIGGRRTVAVFSTLADKDVVAMVAILGSVTDTVIATESSNARVLSATEVWRGITGGRVVSDPVAARAAAIAEAGPEGAVLVCGSLYLLHDLADQLGASPTPAGW